MKVCILCSSLRNYAGSERVVFELAKQILEMKFSLIIGCIDPGEFYFNEMEGIIATDNPNDLDVEYDVIINFHWPSFSYFFPNKIKYKKLILFCLSPYEPTEFPNIFLNPDMIAFNSLESKLSFESKIKEEEQSVSNTELFVFPNSININSYKNPIVRKNRILSKILIVSNHIPQELTEAKELLEKLGAIVHVVGVDSKPEFIDDKKIVEYDLVITIGYTVIMAIACKIPVYVYDHMGGRGFLNDDISLDSQYNFSGRPYQKKKAEEIVYEFIFHYQDNLNNLDKLYSYAKELHCIENNTKTILDCVGLQVQEHKTNISLHKISQSYANMLRTFRYYELEYYKNRKNKSLEEHKIINASDNIVKEINKIKNKIAVFSSDNVSWINVVERVERKANRKIFIVSFHKTDIENNCINILDFIVTNFSSWSGIYTNSGSLAFFSVYKNIRNVNVFLDDIDHVFDIYNSNVNYIVRNQVDKQKLSMLNLKCDYLVDPLSIKGNSKESNIHQVKLSERVNNTVIFFDAQSINYDLLLDIPIEYKLKVVIFNYSCHLVNSKFIADEVYFNPSDELLVSIIKSSDNIILYEDSSFLNDMSFFSSETGSNIWIGKTRKKIDRKLEYLIYNRNYPKFINDEFICIKNIR
jgi:hypothetical protein